MKYILFSLIIITRFHSFSQIKIDFKLSEKETEAYFKSDKFKKEVDFYDVNITKQQFPYKSVGCPKITPHSVGAFVNNNKGARELNIGYYYDCNQVNRVICQFTEIKKFEKYFKSQLKKMEKKNENLYFDKKRNLKVDVRIDETKYFIVWLQFTKI